jgi:hyperosmotically inducible protein
MKKLATFVSAAALLAALLVTPATAAVDGPPDAWVTTKAKIAVLTTVGARGTAIHVDTVNGRVTLHGKVSSSEDKEKAEKAVASIDGVKEVRNLLQVVSAKEAKAVEASDDVIEKKVAEVLKKDPALKGSDIEVQSVNKGTVLLAGKAESLTAQLRAIETAQRVPGVHAVRSEIESPDAKADAEIWRQLGEKKEGAKAEARSTAKAVKGTMSDAYVTAAAKARLLANRDTPGMDINVDTDNGVVTLFGYVPSEQAKAEAEAEARKVAGVKRVVNELQVVPSAQRSQVGKRDSELEERIQKAIGSREGLRDADINVEVKNGVARLTGTVTKASDKEAAVTIARRIDGIRGVANELKVKAN